MTNELPDDEQEDYEGIVAAHQKFRDLLESGQGVPAEIESHIREWCMGTVLGAPTSYLEKIFKYLIESVKDYRMNEGIDDEPLPLFTALDGEPIDLSDPHVGDEFLVYHPINKRPYVAYFVKVTPEQFVWRTRDPNSGIAGGALIPKDRLNPERN